MKSIQSRKTRMFCYVLFLLIFPFTVFGQSKTITGTVYDEDGVTLPGVTVMVAGTTNGTTTNIGGIGLSKRW